MSTDEYDASTPHQRLLTQLRAVIGPLLILIVFIAALWMLHLELRQYTLREFIDALRGVASWKLGVAVLLTLVNYLILVCYDWVGVRYIQHPMPLHRIALASFLGYAVGNNFGTLMGGSAIRYRLYSSWGLSAFEIIKLIFIVGLSYWVGLFALAGVLFLVDPLHIPDRLHLPIDTTRPLGVVVGGLAVAYLVLCALRRRPLSFRNWEFSPPSVTLSLLQYGIASLDLVVAAGAMYVLLPSTMDVPFWHFLGIYLLAIVAGVVSQVPGGLGVLELVILVLLNPRDPQPVVGSLLAYRFIYFLLPLMLGLVLLGGREASQHGWLVRRAVGLVGNWAPTIAPRLLAAGSFLVGVLLIVSSSTHTFDRRLQWLAQFLPLAVIELAHFLLGLTGILLLLLSRSLQRRVDTAYRLTVCLLAVGIPLSFVNGLHYELALVLVLLLIVFIPCRDDFHRQGSLLTERFTYAWMTAAGIALGSCLAVMLFAYKEIDYHHSLWWEFSWSSDLSRSLRAWIGVVVVLTVFVVVRLLRAKHPTPAWPTLAERTEVANIISQSPRASAQLAYLGDKRYLFDSGRSAFLMYGVSGRSLIALGDPVGDARATSELVWSFRDLCDEVDAWSVFYEVSESALDVYIDAGLTLSKLGEEARVRLADFQLQRSEYQRLDRTRRRLQEAGCRFELLSLPQVQDQIELLRDISDEWLLAKNTQEKGFSVGYFDPQYVSKFPVAVVHYRQRPVAFANLWCSADRSEIAVDMLRYRFEAPSSVMEFLFLQVMLWAKQEGYTWFNLGMAPLHQLDLQNPFSPWWNRVATLTYQYGENFYNAQGLRHYKEKFCPVWSPKYLASPGGLTLPTVVTDLSRLISSNPHHAKPEASNLA